MFRIRFYPPRGLLNGIALASLVAIADQLSKKWAFDLLNRTQADIVVFPIFQMTKRMNKGVSFGMLSEANARSGLIIFTSVAILVLLFWLSRAKGKLLPGALGLIIGGAAGNLLDRVRLGAVADFLDFHVGDLHWPAFNLADSAIVIGVGLLFLESFLPKKKDVNRVALHDSSTERKRAFMSSRDKK